MIKHRDVYFSVSPPPGRGGGQKYGQISYLGEKLLKGNEKKENNFSPIGKKYEFKIYYIPPIKTLKQKGKIRQMNT